MNDINNHISASDTAIIAKTQYQTLTITNSLTQLTSSIFARIGIAQSDLNTHINNMQNALIDDNISISDSTIHTAISNAQSDINTTIASTETNILLSISV